MISKFSRPFSITKKILGQMDTNMYLLNFDTHCLIIDPADDASSIINLISQKCPKAKPYIFLTHGHYDHILAVPDLCDHFKGITIFASQLDLPVFNDPFINLSNEFCKSLSITLEKYVKNMKFVKEGEQISFNNNQFDIIGLAGHTPGSIGIHNKNQKCAFVGDTLMRESIGAVTFPLADDDLMMKNIREKLMVLDPDTKIYPGHGEETTIGHEKKENVFISGDEMNAEKKITKLLSALSMSFLEPKSTDFLDHCV